MSSSTNYSGFNLGLAFRVFWKALRNPRFAAQVAPLAAAPTPEPPPKLPSAPPKPSAEPLRLLTILQRDGRLVDFLMEDIAGLPDAQIGAAVRTIHRDCHKALAEHVTLDAVAEPAEGATMTVPPGFDPSAIRVIGNLTGHPPFSGTVRHRGWRAKEVRLPPLPPGQDPFVVAPAEVELA
jgi:hypothetical protein